MDTPRTLIVCNYLPPLEEFCSGMDVVSVEVNGLPGYGFFDHTEAEATVDMLLNRGLWFCRYDDRTPRWVIPGPPANSPEKVE